MGNRPWLWLGGVALTCGAVALASCVSDSSNNVIQVVGDGGGEGSAGQSEAGASDGSAAVDSGSQPVDSAAPFSPTDLGGRLVLWYEGSPASIVLSDAGDGTVLVWKDKSAFKLDAVPTLRSPGAPTYEPDDAGGVRSYVDFTSDKVSLGADTPPANLQFGAREVLVATVVRVRNLSSTAPLSLFVRRESGGGHDGVLALELQSGHVQATVKGDGTDAGGQVVSQNPVLGDMVAHVVTMRRVRHSALSTDDLQIRIDGTPEQVSIGQVALDLSNAGLLMGATHAAGPNANFDFEVAEVLVVSPSDSSPITDQTAQAIEGYLKAKYATP